MNFCSGDGSIANLDTPLPEDPTEYDPRDLPVRGCNRLHCRRCALPVRFVFGRQLKKWPSPDERSALYDEPDLASSPLLRPGAARLYLCRCHLHQALESSGLLGEAGQPEPDAAIFAVLVEASWGCAGHPLATLPRTLDGIEITPDSLTDITVQSLRGQVPAGAAAADRWPGVWAARLYLRLAQTPAQAVVAAAVLASLTDPLADARIAAANAARLVDLPGAGQRALELLVGDRALFAGVVDKTLAAKPATLEHRLWQLARPLAQEAGPAREQAKRDALTPGRWNSTVYALLVQTEPDWVATQLDALLRENAEGGDVLIQAIQQALAEPAGAAHLGHLQQALIEWARQQVLQPGMAGSDRYALLADRDGAWLLSQVDALAQANPARLDLLIKAVDRLQRGPDPTAHKRAQTRLLELVRDRLLSPGQGSAGLYSLMAQRDPQWFTEHLDALVRAQPHDVAGILQAIRPRVPDGAVRIAQAWLDTPGVWNAELYRLLVRDHPQWFAQKAEALARANPDSIPALIQALHDFPARVPSWQALRAALTALASTLPAR